MAESTIPKGIYRNLGLLKSGSYVTGSNLTFSAKPYERIVIAIPVFDGANYSDYQIQVTNVPAGATSVSFDNFTSYHRGIIQNGGVIDVTVWIF